MITEEKLNQLETMAQRGLAVLPGHYTMSAIIELVAEVRRLRVRKNETIQSPQKLLPEVAEHKNQSDDAEFPP